MASIDFKAQAEALRDELVVPGYAVEGGRVTVPSRPGLGVGVDEALLARYRVP